MTNRARDLRPKSLLAVVVALMCLWAVRPALADELPARLTASAQPAAENGETSANRYDEAIIQTEPVDGNRLALDPEPYVNRAPDSGLDYWVRARGGMSYFDVPTDSRVGGLYGLDGSVRLFRALGAYGGVGANHFSGGTQFFSTLGIGKVTNARSSSTMNRFGYSAMFDYVHDSRLGGLDATQFRLTLAYALDENTSAGVIYTEPINVTSGRVVVAPGVTDVGSLRVTRGVHAFVSRYFDRVYTRMSIGHREGPSAVVIAGRLSVPLNDRWSAVATASYEDVGFWTTFTGLEFTFGPNLGPRYRSSTSGCCANVEMPQNETVRGGDYRVGSIGYLIRIFAGGEQFPDWKPSGEMESYFDHNCSCYLQRRASEKSFASPPPGGNGGNGNGGNANGNGNGNGNGGPM